MQGPVYLHIPQPLCHLPKLTSTRGFRQDACRMFSINYAISYHTIACPTCAPLGAKHPCGGSDKMRNGRHYSRHGPGCTPRCTPWQHPWCIPPHSTPPTPIYLTCPPTYPRHYSRHGPGCTPRCTPWQHPRCTSCLATPRYPSLPLATPRYPSLPLATPRYLTFPYLPFPWPSTTI